MHPWVLETFAFLPLTSGPSSQPQCHQLTNEAGQGLWGWKSWPAGKRLGRGQERGLGRPVEEKGRTLVGHLMRREWGTLEDG